MKKIYVAVVFVLFFDGLGAQNKFQVGIYPNLNSFGYSIQQTNDKGFIIAGGAYDDSYVVKTDSVGNVQWGKWFGSANSDVATCARETSDGGFIVLSMIEYAFSSDRDIYIFQTDSIGNVIWTKVIGTVWRDWAYDLRETADGGYIFCGSVTNPSTLSLDFFLCKTDGQGNISWTKTYGGAGAKWAYALEQTSDGGYIIAGEERASDTSAFLVKTDSAGNMQWAKATAANNVYAATSVKQTADGGYVVAGRVKLAGNYDVWLARIDSSGNTLWSRKYGGGLNDLGNNVQLNSDGGFIISGGIRYGIPTSDAYLIKTDSGGNVLWSKKYGGSLNEYAYSVIETSDGGYAFTGYCYNSGWYLYLVKTDNLGNSGCNEIVVPTVADTLITLFANDNPLVGTTGGQLPTFSNFLSTGSTTIFCFNVSVNEIPDEVTTISVFPNPATTEFQIYFNFQPDDEISLTDVLGKIIFSKKITVPTVNFKLQTVNWQQGIYFIEVITKEGKVVKKIVKQ